MLSAGEKQIYGKVVSAVERELITRVLRHAHGHLGNACERLGIDRKTLRNKLRELGITPDKGASDFAEAAD
jgi:DNA-binding NtrC family response regulator